MDPFPTTRLLNDETLKEIEESLNPEHSAETSFFRNLRNSRNTYTKVNAVYSLSVFRPELWSDKRLAEFFLPEARCNIAVAAARAKSIEARSVSPNDTQSSLRQQLWGMIPNLHFCFTRPVFAAIKNAKGISAQMSVTNQAISYLETLDTVTLNKFLDGDRGFLRRALRYRECSHGLVDGHASLSIWDNVCELSDVQFADDDTPLDARIVERMLQHKSVDGSRIDISQYDFEVCNDNLGERALNLSEFPRLLLWSDECFDSPAALPCIEFHENCGFPLFWVRPQRLANSHNALRREIGHYTIVDCSEPRTQWDWNDAVGNKPRFEGFDSDRMAWIWGQHPPTPLTRRRNCIDEFNYLLRRPDVMFAVDAWAMRKLNKWDILLKHLDSISTQDWLDGRVAMD